MAKTAAARRAETLAMLKAYMRVDGDEDDEKIWLLYRAAVQYMENAGIVRRDCRGSEALYDLVAAAITQAAYEPLDVVNSGADAAFGVGLRQQINQLKGVCEVTKAVRSRA